MFLRTHKCHVGDEICGGGLIILPPHYTYFVDSDEAAAFVTSGRAAAASPGKSGSPSMFGVRYMPGLWWSVGLMIAIAGIGVYDILA